MEYSLLLDGHAGFMILAQGSDLDATLSLVEGVEDCPRVSCVGAVNGVSIKNDGHTSGSRQLNVILLTKQVIMDLVESTVEVPRNFVVHFSDLIVV